LYVLKQLVADAIFGTTAKDTAKNIASVNGAKTNLPFLLISFLPFSVLSRRAGAPHATISYRRSLPS